MRRDLGDRPERLLEQIDPAPMARFHGVLDDAEARAAYARIVKEPRRDSGFLWNPRRLIRAAVVTVSIAAAAGLIVWSLGASGPSSSVELPSGHPPVTTTPGAFHLPDLVGRPLREAQRIVRDLGLQPGRPTTRIEKGAPSGEVLAQEPAAGSSVTKGDVVELEIAVPARASGSEVEKLELQGTRGTYRLGEFRTESGQLRTVIIHPDGTRSLGGGCAIGSSVLRLCNVQALDAGGPVLLSGSASASVAEVAAEDAKGRQVRGRVANRRFLILTQGDFRPIRVVGLDAGGGVLASTDGDGVMEATFEVLK